MIFLATLEDEAEKTDGVNSIVISLFFVVVCYEPLKS